MFASFWLRFSDAGVNDTPCEESPLLYRLRRCQAAREVSTSTCTPTSTVGYPGIFKGALLAGAREINLEMKSAAAWALAGVTVSSELIPEVLDRKVHEVVTEAVRQAAIESCIADARVSELAMQRHGSFRCCAPRPRPD
jgi:hypothetical protein